MKVCPKCKKSKRLGEFYKNTKNKYQSWCKECQGNRWYSDREYREKTIAKRNEYRKTKRYKEIHRKDNQLNWLRNKKKVLCRQKLYYAVKTGKIKKGKCEVCKSKKVQAHHEDYSKPYQVNWLCQKHHKN